MFEKERAKADVLIEAIPYIRKFAGSIVVVKYGGSAMIDEKLKKCHTFISPHTYPPYTPGIYN